MVKVGIDYHRVEAQVDGVGYTLSRTEWRLYAALWEANGDYVSAFSLASKADVSLDGVRWHISRMRSQIGAEVIKRHDRKWPGWRLNIPVMDFELDFDYREDY